LNLLPWPTTPIKEGEYVFAFAYNQILLNFGSVQARALDALREPTENTQACASGAVVLKVAAEAKQLSCISPVRGLNQYADSGAVNPESVTSPPSGK
jgi:hypothetical protein